jgi:type I restriction enzyme, S subunit
MSFPSAPIDKAVTNCATWNPRTNGRDVFTYIDLSSVDKDAKTITVVEQYPCSEAPSRARQIIEKGDVLVATVRPNLNGVALVGAEYDGATASTGFCVLRPIPEKLDAQFLFHWVKTKMFIQRMIDVATGANYPAVSDAKVKASTIPLPPLAEQKRIAAILDAADTLRAKRREAIAQLDSFLQSTFVDMFGDPVRNEKGWEVISGAKAFANLTYGTSEKAFDEQTDCSLPVLRIPNILGGKILWSDLKYIKLSGSPKDVRISYFVITNYSGVQIAR